MGELTCKDCGRPIPAFRFQAGRIPKDFVPAKPRCPWCRHPKNRGKLPQPVKGKKET